MMNMLTQYHRHSRTDPLPVGILQKYIGERLDPFNMKRGLNRTEAAEYIGIGTTKFDALVEDRRMPSPKLIDKRNVWDVRELDDYFDRLPVRDGNERVWRHLE